MADKKEGKGNRDKNMRKIEEDIKEKLGENTPIWIVESVKELMEAQSKKLPPHESLKCPKCMAYNGHSPECPLMDFETAKKMVSQYYKAWLGQEQEHRKMLNWHNQRARDARKDAEFWKGKFNTVKIENNALRKKINKANKP